MNIKEVTIKQLIDIAHKNWGYRTRNNPIVSTTLDILNGDDFTSTGNIRARTVKCIEIFNPFVQRGAKLIGLYTLTNKEWEKLKGSGILEELNKSSSQFDSKKIDEICKKLYR